MKKKVGLFYKKNGSFNNAVSHSRGEGVWT